MYAGKKLRKLRLSLDINQTEMAKSLGLSQSYYSAVEAGKRKITPKMIEKITATHKVDGGYFTENNGGKKMGGKNGGYDVGELEDVVNNMADERGLKGENKAIFAIFKLIENLFIGRPKNTQIDEIAATLLAETEKWEDKTLNYYLRSTKEISIENPELDKIRNLVEEVLVDTLNLNKIMKTYFESVLNSDIEFIDYKDFKTKRVRNLEQLKQYNQVLEPLFESLQLFIADFAKFDDKKVVK
jgi:transcriptional regulator with XRE-family HTH domain